MASAVHKALNIEQYLSMSFEHDMEYVDGELREKPLPSRIHGRVQALLAAWFVQFEEQFGFDTFTEPRTRVSSERVRLPDIALVPTILHSGKVLAIAPLLAIEIRSEDDKERDLSGRAQDLAAMGAQAVWLLDPEKRMLFIWSGDAWLPSREEKPMTPAGAPLDLAWLWRKAGLPGAEEPQS